MMKPMKIAQNIISQDCEIFTPLLSLEFAEAKALADAFERAVAMLRKAASWRIGEYCDCAHCQFTHDARALLAELEG